MSEINNANGFIRLKGIANLSVDDLFSVGIVEYPLRQVTTNLKQLHPNSNLTCTELSRDVR